MSLAPEKKNEIDLEGIAKQVAHDLQDLKAIQWTSDIEDALENRAYDSPIYTRAAYMDRLFVDELEKLTRNFPTPSGVAGYFVLEWRLRPAIRLWPPPNEPIYKDTDYQDGKLILEALPDPALQTIRRNKIDLALQQMEIQYPGSVNEVVQPMLKPRASGTVPAGGQGCEVAYARTVENGSANNWIQDLKDAELGGDAEHKDTERRKQLARTADETVHGNPMADPLPLNHRFTLADGQACACGCACQSTAGGSSGECDVDVEPLSYSSAAAIQANVTAEADEIALELGFDKESATYLEEVGSVQDVIDAAFKSETKSNLGEIAKLDAKARELGASVTIGPGSTLAQQLVNIAQRPRRLRRLGERLSQLDGLRKTRLLGLLFGARSSKA